MISPQEEQQGRAIQGHAAGIPAEPCPASGAARSITRAPRQALAILALALATLFMTPPAALAQTGSAADAPSYVGTNACASCHAPIHERFTRQSKKARTRILVEKLQPKLSPEEQSTCFKCHATGYGQKGGFVSYAQTPELGDIGCEACHGPGSKHIENGDPAYINKNVPVDHCYSCHTPEQNRRKNFTPLPHGGAH